MFFKACRGTQKKPSPVFASCTLAYVKPSLVGRGPFCSMPVPHLSRGLDLSSQLFPIHSIHLLSLNCAHNQRDRFFEGKGLENFIHLAGWKGNQLLCASLLSPARLFPCAVFQLSPIFPVSQSICIRKQLHQM